MASLTACLIFPNATLQAQPVTDWHTFKATPATTLSGQGTDDPVLGTTATTGSAAFLIGYLNSPLSLANVGDRISVRYDVSFNDAAGMANANDNFRFALFDLNGQPRVAAENTGTAGITGQTDNWRGYWFGVRTAATGGSIRERTGTADNPFANASATLLGTPGGDAVNFSSAVNGVGGALYSGELTLELTASGVDLSGYFGGNGATNTFSFSDNSSPFTSNFEAVGFLNGGPLNNDQVLFQNVTVTLTPVPEPSSVVLAFVGLIGFILFRIRRSRA